MENIILQQLSVSDFKEIISDTIKKEIRESHPGQNTPEQYLTRKDTAKLLQVSLVTLRDWSVKGILQSYKIGGRIRYKKSEIDESLKEVKNLKYRRK